MWRRTKNVFTIEETFEKRPDSMYLGLDRSRTKSRLMYRRTRKQTDFDIVNEEIQYIITSIIISKTFNKR